MPCALLLCPPRDSLFLKDPKHTSHCTGFWRPLCWLKTCLLAWCRRENPFKQIEQRCLRVPSPDTMYSSATKPSDSPELPREVKILSKETLCVNCFYSNILFVTSNQYNLDVECFFKCFLYESLVFETKPQISQEIPVISACICLASTWDLALHRTANVFRHTKHTKPSPYCEIISDIVSFRSKSNKKTLIFISETSHSF